MQVRRSLFQIAHKNSGAPNYYYDGQENKISSTGDDANECEWLAGVLLGIIFDLDHLIDSERDRNGPRDDAQIATPANGHREDSANHRSDGEPLFRPLRIRRRWRRLPTA